MTHLWAETIPSNTSAVGQLPGYLRDIWQTISDGMAVEHFWPGTGVSVSEASTGELLPGASRTFVAPKSQASRPAGTSGNGFLFLCSDTSQLLAYDSVGTFLQGTPHCDEVLSNTGSRFWARISQTTAVPTGASAVTITWGAGGGGIFKFDQPPVVVSATVSDGSWLVGASNVAGAAQTVSYYSSLLNAVGPALLTVEALGLVSSTSF